MSRAAVARKDSIVQAGDSDGLEVRPLQVTGADGALDARLYKASADGKRDVLIVFFHGGGFVDGDLDQPDSFLRHLAMASGSPVVLSSTYTKATVKPFPAAAEDAHAVLLWAKKHKAKLGWTGKRLLVAGIEAGANLAAVCSLMARDRGAPKLDGQVLLMPMLDPGLTTCSMREMPNCLDKAKLGWTGKRLLVAGIEAGANLAAVCSLMARDRGAPKLDGQVLLMPMLDPGLTTCSMREMPSCLDKAKLVNECAAAYRGYLPNASDRSHPYASPLQSSRLKNLPPALILAVDDDPLRDEAEAYGAKLIQYGVPTTVRRLAPARLQDPNARNECACKAHALSEIANFIAGLEQDDLPEGC